MMAGLAVLVGCQSQPLATKLQPAVSSAPSSTRLDLDALEQKKADAKRAEEQRQADILKAEQDCKVKKVSAAVGESLSVDQIIIEFE